MIGLMLTFRREARADNLPLRAEFRADMQTFREEVHADFAQVRGDLGDLRKDVQALTERTSRLECVIQGLFGLRDDAA